ncbi:hypothetical protein G7Y89_g8306 [Cudoniella acicularis]|uniref:Uncharacterized protein n=1 Tax=Cudoniella acicularis TaxID=354080 RepID=A0A8H4RGT5_9HELO|nr:hypothetical protein G7Y89_g8306 [Cudoniella acicularis]
MDIAPPFSEHEKRFILAEAIKTSSIPLDKLLSVLSDSNIQPAWPHMLLPYGRTLQSCIEAYDSLIQSGQPSPYSSLSLPSTSQKRKSRSDSLEHLMTGPPPKWRQSGTESISSARNIRPKPFSSGSSPPPFSSLPGPPATQPRKRGRPSKLDIELRQAEAIARGEVLPPRKTITQRSQKQTTTTKESSIIRFPVITPIITTTSAESIPSIKGQYQGEPSMIEAIGKKTRARVAPRQPKVGYFYEREKKTNGLQKSTKNPVESAFSAVKEPQAPAPLPPSEPVQSSQYKKEETLAHNAEAAPSEVPREPQPLDRDQEKLTEADEEQVKETKSKFVAQRIRDTIQLHALQDKGIYLAHCKVSWHIYEFCQEQLCADWTLHPVVTLTGTTAQAQAASCEDFVKLMWSSKGLQLLNAVVHYIREASCDIKFSPNHWMKIHTSHLDSTKGVAGDAEVTLSGSLDEVSAAFEQLAWIAAVFRPPAAVNALTISSIDFSLLEPAEAPQLAIDPDPMRFALRLDTKILEPSKTLETISSEERSTCWHELFRGGVLAYNFPIAQRDEGSGLEIPFDLMVHLAQVRLSMDYDDGAILLGHSSMLFPSQILPDGVQWHLDNATDTRSLNSALKSHGERVREKDFTKLAPLRTFLGSYPSACVLLGTEELFHENCIANSDLDRSASRIELAREGTTTAGFSVKSTFNIGLGLKWTLQKGLRVNLDNTLEYLDRVDQASDRPILVYDYNSKSAWLVPELSLVLHMVLTYLKQPKVQQRRSRDAWPRLPFAKAAPNGGEAARKAILDNQNLYLYTNQIGDNVLLWMVADGFLKDLATIRLSKRLQTDNSGWQLVASRLQGWDFNDLATKQESVFQTELPTDSARVSWWTLTKSNGLLVIFGRDFGHLVAPDLTQTKVYSGWECLPANAELLAASMPYSLTSTRSSGDVLACKIATRETPALSETTVWEIVNEKFGDIFSHNALSSRGPGSTKACETFPDGYGTGTLTTPAIRNKSWENTTMSIADKWIQVATQYTDKSPILRKDKLIAISGIARQFASKFGTTYVVGMWKEEMAIQLAWWAEKSSTIDIRDSIPPWSWAVIDVRASMHTRFTLLPDFVPLVSILEASTIVVNDYFGDVKEGTIRLHCPFPFIATLIMSRDSGRIWASRITLSSSASHSLRFTLYPDRKPYSVGKVITLSFTTSLEAQKSASYDDRFFIGELKEHQDNAPSISNFNNATSQTRNHPLAFIVVSHPSEGLDAGVQRQFYLGTANTMRYHVDAMQRVVALKGGLQSTVLDGVILRLIDWNDA